MSAQSQELAHYYEELILAQYRDKPKAVATIVALISGTGEYGLIASALPNQVRDAFDIDTAVGKQLDMLGKLRGVGRYFITIDLSKTFLPLVDYDDPAAGTLIGIANYDDAVQPPAAHTMTYDDFILNTLQDGDFRRVIKFLAAVHSCDYSYAILDSILYTFFIGNVNLKVNGNMAIIYQHLTSDTDNLFLAINQMGLLPTPAGVGVTVSEVGAF